MSFSRWRLVATAAGFSAFAAGGCGGAAPTTTAPPSFGAVALQSVTSASGGLRVEVRSSPQPPVRGLNAVQLAVSDGDGNLVADLTVDVLPWMPAHGHGASVQPKVSADADGVFVADPLYLFMSGRWELRTTIGGARDDTATATLDIP